MPWFKCSQCRIRRSGRDVAISAAQDRCPLCGRMLEPERDLTALMGFSVLTDAGAGGRTDADTIADALAAQRWLDEGGSSEPRR